MNRTLGTLLAMTALVGDMSGIGGRRGRRSTYDPYAGLKSGKSDVLQLHEYIIHGEVIKAPNKIAAKKIYSRTKGK